MQNIIGMKFGKVEVLEYCLPMTQMKTYMNCIGKCECGNIKQFTVTGLKSGNTGSCGCLQRRRGAQHPSYGGVGELDGNYWSSLRKDAKRRNRDFSVTIQEAWDKFLDQDRKCALSGLDLTMLCSRKLDNNTRTASLDRIDSTRGYTVDNIQWVHKDINRMKWDFSLKNFLKLCDAVAEHNPNFVYTPPESAT